ncbi:hypothetical protein C0993_000792 [Termitomyces sp. T159_Od127]|nr:hypothetical protein C0993_000792 [Termitomyces sp. T159_Od127]
MVTLTVDPNAETIPDFTSEEFRFPRQALLSGREDGTNELAIEILTNTWNAKQERRRALWEAEREEREASRREVQQRERGAERDQGVDEEIRHARNSRAQSPRVNKAPNLVAGKPVPEAIEYPPARFAIKKLVERDYIELSYFTPEGREEAARNESVASQEIFTIAKDDDMFALKPVVNFKAKVIEKWPVNMIEAMHAFFFHLTNHKLRNKGADGLRVLILYQARIRREWHRQIKNPPCDGIFDIGMIDGHTLRTLKDQVYDAKRSALLAEGKDPYLRHGIKNMNQSKKRNAAKSFFTSAQVPQPAVETVPTLPVWYALAATHTTSGTAQQESCGTENKRMSGGTAATAWSTQKAESYAPTGRNPEVVKTPCMITNMSALAVEREITALKAALSHNCFKFATPNNTKAWAHEIKKVGLEASFGNLVHELQEGFNAGISTMLETFAPYNWDSVDVTTELKKGDILAHTPDNRWRKYSVVFRPRPSALYPSPTNQIASTSYKTSPTHIRQVENETLSPSTV